MSNTTEFTETQRFTQWWIRIFFFLIIGLFVYAIIQQFIFKVPFGNKPMSDIGLIIASIIVLSISYLFWTIRMETQISKDVISIRFVPFHKEYRIYKWEDVESAIVREYKPVMEYGGWGIRGIGKNKAINVSGNKGLQLVFKDGRKLLIGTQKAKELTDLLENRKINS